MFWSDEKFSFPYNSILSLSSWLLKVLNIVFITIIINIVEKVGSSPRSLIRLAKWFRVRGHWKKACLVVWSLKPQLQDGSGTLLKLWQYMWFLKIRSHLVLFINISSCLGSSNLLVTLNLFFPLKNTRKWYLNEFLVYLYLWFHVVWNVIQLLCLELWIYAAFVTY